MQFEVDLWAFAMCSPALSPPLFSTADLSNKGNKPKSKSKKRNHQTSTHALDIHTTFIMMPTYICFKTDDLFT